MVDSASSAVLAALVAAHPGAAVLFDADLAILDANPLAEGLMAALQRGAMAQLAEPSREALESGCGSKATLTLPGDLGGAVLEITLLPLHGAERAEDRVLALARDISLDHNLRNALVESRQRYKDLVECSADFAWETDGAGRFAFVSPKGALGFTPDDLVDHDPRGFLTPGMEQDTERVLPFFADHPTEDELVWMTTAAGRPTCLKVSSVPLRGTDGAWGGARGVCQDITAARAKELLLEIAQRRERALGAVVTAMRNEPEPQAMLEAATRTIAETLCLAGCWILRHGDDDTVAPASAFPAAVEPPSEVLDRLAALATQAEAASQGTVEVAELLLAPSHHAQAINGGVAIRRPAGEAWSDDDRDLLQGLAGHVGIALEQASSREKLQALSRTDPLTGLLNRRAFMDEATRRLSHCRRNARPGAILFIDFDNFKALNDQHGHAAGDSALIAVTGLIDGSSRASDIVARVGGDEMQVWLDETGEDGAKAKAQALIDGLPGLTDVPVVPDRPFGLSIGIAVFDPASSETLAALVERADAAMYDAKSRRGMSCYAVAGKGRA
jgi:diguanylate cyclase (GGDEF)-like protein/PAS domain S-box-containing protein